MDKVRNDAPVNYNEYLGIHAYRLEVANLLNEVFALAGPAYIEGMMKLLAGPRTSEKPEKIASAVNDAEKVARKSPETKRGKIAFILATCCVNPDFAALVHHELMVILETFQPEEIGNMNH